MLILLVLGMLSAFAPATIDSYLPALPTIATELGVDAERAQRTLSATMAGFAVGQLIVGPWSDRIGRLVPVVLGCVLHAAASLSIVFAQGIDQLLWYRAAQGFAAAASAVVALAAARDRFEGRALMRALSIVAVVSGVAPLLAPTLGGALIAASGWRAVFGALAGYAVLVLLCALFVLGGKGAGPASVARPDRRERWRSLDFFGLAPVLVLAAVRFTAMFAYLEGSPFLLQERYGLDELGYGASFAFTTLGMLGGVQIAPLLLRRLRARSVLRLGFSLFLPAALLLALAATDPLPLWLVLAGCTLLMLGCGITLPVLQVLALQPRAAVAGTAAALFGASGFGGAALLGPLLALLPFGTHLRIAIAVALAAVVAFALVHGVRARGS